MMDMDILRLAWYKCKKGKGRGAPGIDGLTFEIIENKIGMEEFLKDILNGLRGLQYEPERILRKYIKKSNGKLRFIGIPTVKDRIVQRACLFVLEPIFEADFLDCSLGFRPVEGLRERCINQHIKTEFTYKIPPQHVAVLVVMNNIRQGRSTAYNLDIENCFDTLNHELIFSNLMLRIKDPIILKLIKQWLNAEIVEGNSNYYFSAKGVVQGNVISPLLANIALHSFDKLWYEKNGPSDKYNSELVRYADDFVIMSPYPSTNLEYDIGNILNHELGLKINEDKTRIVNLRNQEEFINFMGFTIRMEKVKPCRIVIDIPPGPILKLESKIRELVSDKSTKVSGNCDLIYHKTQIQLLNWLSYYGIANTPRPYNKIKKDLRWILKGHFSKQEINEILLHIQQAICAGKYFSKTGNSD